MATLESDAASFQEHSDQLRELVLKYNPIQLIRDIAVRAKVFFSYSEAPDDTIQTFGAEAKIEHLLGLIFSGPPGNEKLDEEAITTVIQLLERVFSGAIACLTLERLAKETDPNQRMCEVAFLLSMEHLYDRMAGYEIHLGEISQAVFEPQRATYLQELGFCPSDITRLVREYRNECSSKLKSSYDAYFAANQLGSDRDLYLLDKVIRSYNIAIRDIFVWTPDKLATTTGLPVHEIRSYLQKVSKTIGVQPDYRTPLDENIARIFPVLKFSEEIFIVPDSWALVNGMYQWLHHYKDAYGSSNFKMRYQADKSAGTEELIYQTLRPLFGPQAVFKNRFYPRDERHLEIDCLVAGFNPIVIEAKSKPLSDEGRRGNPDQIQKVAKEVARNSFLQTAEACSYIVEEGGRHFSDKSLKASEKLLPDEIGVPIEIVVTMESMDPLTMAAQSITQDDPPREVWVTNLVDLMMVANILNDPASFTHYARIRGRLAGIDSLRVIQELDLLEMYLHDRCEPLLERIVDPELENTFFFLNYRDGRIDRFYRASSLGYDAIKPTTGVPSVILEALRHCSGNSSHEWAIVADAVMNTPRRRWAKWSTFVQENLGEHPFAIPGRTAAITVSPEVEHAELRSGAVPALLIPRESL